MNIAIVEDETVVARRLERMIRAIVTAESVTVAASIEEGLALLGSQRLDLLFLDLNLRGVNGFRLLDELQFAALPTIVVSAHGEQALRAFEYGVADFVPKPWTEERLRLAIERATARPVPHRGGTIVVRRGREQRKIALTEILFIRGADDYSEVHCAAGSIHLHEKSLTALERLLPESFVRVHRSWIVNLTHARGVRSAAIVLTNGAVVPIGRVYRDAVRDALALTS